MNELEIQTKWSAKQDQFVGNRVLGVSCRRERRDEKVAPSILGA